MCSVDDEADITFEEDEKIVRGFSCTVNMGTGDEAADLLFNRDENSHSPTLQVISEVTANDSHVYWTTDPSKEVELRMENEGVASEKPFTIIDMFRKAVDKCGDKPAISVKKMETWHHWTYERYFNNCQTLAKAFIEVTYTSLLISCLPPVQQSYQSNSMIVLLNRDGCY